MYSCHGKSASPSLISLRVCAFHLFDLHAFSYLVNVLDKAPHATFGRVWQGLPELLHEGGDAGALEEV